MNKGGLLSLCQKLDFKRNVDFSAFLNENTFE